MKQTPNDESAGWGMIVFTIIIVALCIGVATAIHDTVKETKPVQLNKKAEK